MLRNAQQVCAPSPPGVNAPQCARVAREATALTLSCRFWSQFASLHHHRLSVSAVSGAPFSTAHAIVLFSVLYRASFDVVVVSDQITLSCSLLSLLII